MLSASRVQEGKYMEGTGIIPRAMGLTYWLKMRAREIVKLKMLKPFARIL
jgi:hypothetical protein